jgi:hypothetical protein
LGNKIKNRQMELHQNKKFLHDKTIRWQPVYWKKMFLRYISHKAGGVAQVVEHLPSKHEAMEFNY